MSDDTDRIEKQIEELRRELASEQDELCKRRNAETADERVKRDAVQPRP